MAYRTKTTFYPRMEKSPPFSFEVSDVEKRDGETLPRRNTRCKGGLITQPDPSVRTAYDILTYAAKKFGNANCVGTRTVLNVHKETKKVKKMVDGQEAEVDKEWSYFELSPYTFMSFVQFQQLVWCLGAGLKNIGLEKDDRIHLYGATSMHWLSIAHGAFTQSFTVVTAYDTLGLEGLRWSLEQTKSRAVFIDSGLLSTFIQALKSAPTIEYIILNNESKPAQEHLDMLASEFPNIRVIPYDDLKKLGEENSTEPVPPVPEDLACIMYTSGTSGTPKGVTIKHKAIVAAVAGATSIVGEYLGPADAVLTYLPQAHIIAFIYENASIFWGIKMGYGSPKTLTDSSVRNCKGDILELRPTILIGVPAVWETIRKGIVSKVESGSEVARKLFWKALAAKKSLLAKGLPGVKLLDAIVFDKVRAATGGRLRICMSGGGPLARDTQVFISMAICPLISGYGLTETCGMGALNDPRAWTVDAHGDIPGCVELKLVDYPDAGYYTTNNPPQGELCIRGPAVTTEYYLNEEETNLAIQEDGWFYTGDIAEFNIDGHVKLVDRKKNLVKTLNGEYIALEKLESIYLSSPLVANVCVYGAPDRSKPIAIIVPAEPALLNLAHENGIEGYGLEDLVDNKKLGSLILKDVQKTGRQAHLAGFEIIEGIVLDKDEWTAENGFLTATRKLQRRNIVEKHKAGIDRAYGKC